MIHVTEVLAILIPGAKRGLSLLLNVEQYEHMRGPETDAGVKVNYSLLK